MRELYLLERYFHIGADEALYERPAWQLNNLLRHLAADLKQESS